jgi:hypothetical protein
MKRKHSHNKTMRTVALLPPSSGLKKKRASRKQKGGFSNSKLYVYGFRNPLTIWRDTFYPKDKLEGVSELQTQVFFNEGASSISDSMNDVDGWLIDTILYGVMRPNIKTIRPLYKQEFGIEDGGVLKKSSKASESKTT